jgi:SAM-dependent methyltransferase
MLLSAGKSMNQTDIVRHNRQAWDRQVELGNRWTRPVTPAEIARARLGEWSILLTPTVPVPRGWFPALEGTDVLCLASGGGQQGPILAAAGARVTVFDNSPLQLAQDRAVAEREQLEIETLEGDMADLSTFDDRSFDLIVHPVSNCFVPDVRPVWRESYRVLRPGGALLAGFTNGFGYIFDLKLYQRGILQVRHALPYSDLASLTAEEQARILSPDAPVEFGHRLDDQIGGQIAAGFLIAGLYEDVDPDDLLAQYVPGFIATRALRPLRAGIVPDRPRETLEYSEGKDD